jgi:hypothetical protein
MRRPVRLELNCLDSRLVPTTLSTGAVVAVNHSVIDIVPAIHGETAVSVSQDATTSTSIDVAISSTDSNGNPLNKSLVIAKGGGLELEVDGRRMAADSELDLNVSTNNPTLVLGGAGVANISLGNGVAEVVAGSGSTNVSAGNGTEYIYGSKNSASLLNFSGGAGFNFIDVDGGTNNLTLGSGFSVVLVDGGTTTISSAAGGSAIIIVDIDDPNVTINTAGADDWVFYVN